MNTGHPQENSDDSVGREPGESMRANRPRFSWPPKPVSGELRAPEPDAPPLRSASMPAVSSRAQVADVSRARTWWQDFERTWIEFESAPLAERLAERDWQPDHPSVYCPRCGVSTGPFEADAESGCSRCRTTKLPWSRLVRLGSYHDLLRDLILEVKLARWRRLGHDLGMMLGIQLAREMEQACVHASQVHLVPVPMAWPRRLIRGIDHAKVITRGILAGARLEDPDRSWQMAEPICRRYRATQAGLGMTARRENVAGAFRPARWFAMPTSGNSESSNNIWVLVDDIKTTGATLQAASRVLNQTMGRLDPASVASGGQLSKGPRTTRIWTAVLAVTPLEEGRTAPDSA
jgi:predicted amidophosphoribosyltransferase